MPPQKPARKHSRQSANGSVAPLVAIEQAGLRSLLAQYQRWRTDRPLDERFAELVWSPEGMWPEVPVPIIKEPDEAHERLVERRVDNTFWWNRKMQHGDGQWQDRKKLQEDALGKCEAMVRARLERARARAENSVRDWDQKLEVLKTEVAEKECQLKIQICEIGERFRDEWWLRLRSGRFLDWVRDDFGWKMEEQSNWPPLLNKHLAFAQDHLGAVVDPDTQEYLLHLRRLHELWPRIQWRLDFRQLRPKDARYRRPGKGGKPRPKVAECRKALRALRPKLPQIAIEQILIAWCLKAI